MAMLGTLLPPLRRLKLSGVLDAIPARAKEARSRDLNVLDLLLLLLEDELARREAEVVAQRLRWARFDEICHLRDFGYHPEIPRARLWELASGRYLEERASVWPSGPTGVGKALWPGTSSRRTSLRSTAWRFLCSKWSPPGTL